MKGIDMIVSRPRQSGRVWLALLAALDATALCTVHPNPGRLQTIAEHPSRAFQQQGVDHVVTLFALGAVWLVAAWVALGLLAALGTALPGLSGRVCAVVAFVALPAALRRVTIGALGIGLLAGPATAAFAAPASTSAPSRTAVVSVSEGQVSSPDPGPSWPTSTPSHPHHHSTRPPSGHDDTVRVQRGDSLWVIAAHRLGAGASPRRTAAYWPQVYAANRSVVGPDPDLVVPGQLLHLPDPPSS